MRDHFDPSSVSAHRDETERLIESLKNHAEELRDMLARSRQTVLESREMIRHDHRFLSSTSDGKSCPRACTGRGLARSVAIRDSRRTVTFECDTCHHRWNTDEMLRPGWASHVPR